MCNNCCHFADGCQRLRLDKTLALLTQQHISPPDNSEKCYIQTDPAACGCHPNQKNTLVNGCNEDTREFINVHHCQHLFAALVSYGQVGLYEVIELGFCGLVS